jgi:hypothetical protein
VSARGERHSEPCDWFVKARRVACRLILLAAAAGLVNCGGNSSSGNNGGSGLYCSANNPICQPLPAGPYYITQLDPRLKVEWSFLSTKTDSCHRNSDGSISCTPNTNPNGFEWCVNAPVIDQNGVVYANSEDGNLYSIAQGNTGVFTTPKQTLFTNLAIGAAYTPLSVGPDGKLYVQNDGHLFVIGN